MVTAWKQHGCEGRKEMMKMTSEVILSADPRGRRATLCHLHDQPSASTPKARFLPCRTHPTPITVLMCLSFPPFQIPSLSLSQKWPFPSPHSSCTPISQLCLASQALSSLPPFPCSLLVFFPLFDIQLYKSSTISFLYILLYHLSSLLEHILKLPSPCNSSV